MLPVGGIKHIKNACGRVSTHLKATRFCQPDDSIVDMHSLMSLHYHLRPVRCGKYCGNECRDPSQIERAGLVSQVNKHNTSPDAGLFRETIGRVHKGYR